mgnify:CR=1 FL=1
MIKLYRHQEIALSYLRSNEYFALFMEQGTGKTIPTLCRLLELLRSGDIKDALVVAPKSALGAWDRDIELFDPDDQQILSDGITLINYDKVWRGDKKSPYYKAWGAIVLDEAHNIKNRSSKRSKFLLKVATLSKYRYILTGTPISNGQLENIWSLYTFLDPYLERGYPRSHIFGGSYKQFEDRYCILNMYHKPSSYIHVRELQDIINEHSYRVKKVDCLDLPDKLPDEIVKVNMIGGARKYYKQIATESAILDFDILAENPLTRLLHLRQIASGFISNESGEIIELNTDKLSALQDIIEGFPDDKKIVIFAEFKHSIKKISKLMDKMRIRYFTLDGDQKDKTIWRRFQNAPYTRIIICQYQTANSGIDLYASDTIIYYEPTLRSVVLEQSRDRIHRTGQVNKCSYIHLLTKGTVEIDIYRALSGYSDFSEKLFSEYMDGYRRSYN